MGCGESDPQTEFIKMHIFEGDRRVVDVLAENDDCAGLRRSIERWSGYIDDPSAQVGNYHRDRENLEAAVDYAGRTVDELGC